MLGEPDDRRVSPQTHPDLLPGRTDRSTRRELELP